MYTYTIFRDGKQIEQFTNQTSDISVFKYLLSHQSQSTDWALRHGGYKVTVLNEDDGTLTDYKTGKEIKPTA